MRIFYDVDTQNDFMNANGALYVPEAEVIKPQLGRLTLYAIMKNIKVVGSVDKHFGTPEYKTREGELSRYGGPFPDHCMDGTHGQEKIDQTLFWSNKRQEGASKLYISHALDGTLDERFVAQFGALIKNFTEGLYFEKQSYDVFTNPNITEFLKRAGIREAIVYGVATDYCVKAAVLGMQKLGVQCYVVEDAIKGITPESSRAALEEMAAAGAKFTTTQNVLEGKI